MGRVEILNQTTPKPITLIGKMAGICYGADTNDDDKNYKRGIECIKANHGRTLEFPEVYMVLHGYSAKLCREIYTHIGGAPTRLQSSTRYINYDNMDCIIPNAIATNKEALATFKKALAEVKNAYHDLTGVFNMPKEDASMLLPLGMVSTMCGKWNARTLMTMFEQRLCARAFWEYRQFMNDLYNALSGYSSEWNTLCDLLYKCKCEKAGRCLENDSCGKFDK